MRTSTHITLTPEELAVHNQKISEAMKAYHARREGRYQPNWTPEARELAANRARERFSKG